MWARQTKQAYFKLESMLTLLGFVCLVLVFSAFYERQNRSWVSREVSKKEYDHNILYKILKK